MTSRILIFALWCAVMLIGSVYHAYNAYSFYSDTAERPAAAGRSGGPTHK